MGSIEEEELLQMVHDFMESSEPTISSPSLLSNNFCNPHTTLKHDHFTRHFTLQEILMKKTREEKEIIEKVGKYMRKKMDLEKTSELKQWLVQCLKFEGFCASLSHTSWVTTPSCPCGSYEYIEIVEGGTQRVVVDIDFKSQFEVARPSESYIQLSSKLPKIFIGNEDKLKKIIYLVCSAAEESLREKGLHIPPWRRAPYMLSKWKLSNNSSNNYNNKKYPNNNIDYNTNNNQININNHNNYPNYPSSSRLEKWAPKKVMMKGRRRELSGGESGLSNQFSNLGINCC
ncbi:unnamed protein product [Amaranthus hypochondriacus]